MGGGTAGCGGGIYVVPIDGVDMAVNVGCVETNGEGNCEGVARCTDAGVNVTGVPESSGLAWLA